MQRRQYLTSVGTVVTTGVAGCMDLVETEQVGGEPPVLEDRPDAVYIPTHDEGMAMVGMGEAGEYAIGVMYSFPHRFWTITGTTRERVEIQDDDAVHLMATVWDPDTMTVLPVGSGLSMTIERGDEFITERAPWPMISQTMGFHFGDNLPLPGDDTYSVTIDISDMGIQRFGEFADRFTDQASTTIEFEFSTATRDDIRFDQLDEQAGTQAALELMDMEMMPTSVLPPASDLPGQVVGEGESGDATFVISVVDEAPFAPDDEMYLLVSPRTPYNRIPLPLMSVSCTVKRNGESLDSGPLQAAIEPSAGYHYGMTVDDIRTGDHITIQVDSPPQISRHEGFETAFLEMEEFTLEFN